MQGITSEWIEKAEGDFRTAQRELHASPPNFALAYFERLVKELDELL